MRVRFVVWTAGTELFGVTSMAISNCVFLPHRDGQAQHGVLLETRRLKIVNLVAEAVARHPREHHRITTLDLRAQIDPGRIDERSSIRLLRVQVRNERSHSRGQGTVLDMPA